MMKIFNYPLVTVTALLSACGNDSAENEDTNTLTVEIPREINGYDTIVFGSSFEEVITNLDINLFNPVAIRDCFKDLPLKGCFISGDNEAPPFQITDGIPYSLSLSINRFDKLTDINLNYDREGDISRAQCLEIHERTIDWIVREYGQMRADTSNTEANAETRMTAGKNSYVVSTEDEESFVTRPMRTLPVSGSANLDKMPITKWDANRYVSILTHYIVVDGKPICGVNVGFSEPESIERWKY